MVTQSKKLKKSKKLSRLTPLKIRVCLSICLVFIVSIWLVENSDGLSKVRKLGFSSRSPVSSNPLKKRNLLGE